MIGTAVVVVGVTAEAQNLDAGKSPERIFSDTCNACHRSPRELKPTTPGFMREHYTTGAREAAAMAAYLSSIGSDTRAVQQRKPPSLGAGKDVAPPDTPPTRPPQSVPAGAAADRGATPDQAKPSEQGKPPETQATATPPRRTGQTPPGDEQAKPAPAPATATAAVRPRRPSESIESGRFPAAVTAAGGGETPPQTLAAPAARPSPAEEFEE
jgi:hypothetical protein